MNAAGSPRSGLSPLPDDPWHPRRIAGPAAVAALLLLLSFHQVVGGAVRHAREQQGAASQRAAAAEGCRAMGDAATRSLCLSRLDSRMLADADLSPTLEH